VAHFLSLGWISHPITHYLNKKFSVAIFFEACGFMRKAQNYLLTERAFKVIKASSAPNQGI